MYMFDTKSSELCRTISEFALLYDVIRKYWNRQSLGINTD